MSTATGMWYLLFIMSTLVLRCQADVLRFAKTSADSKYTYTVLDCSDNVTQEQDGMSYGFFGALIGFNVILVFVAYRYIMRRKQKQQEF